MTRAKRFQLALGCQVLILVGMIVGKVFVLQTGESVLLKIVPVDPRDLFRGDYVTLSYDLSSIPTYAPPSVRSAPPGTTVYVTLEKGSGSKFARAVAWSTESPGGSVLRLRGTIGHGRLLYGIESFFVPEKKGGVVERAARTLNDRLGILARVSRSGTAVIESLALDGRAVDLHRIEGVLQALPGGAMSMRLFEQPWRDSESSPVGPVWVKPKVDPGRVVWGSGGLERRFVVAMEPDVPCACLIEEHPEVATCASGAPIRWFGLGSMPETKRRRILVGVPTLEQDVDRLVAAKLLVRCSGHTPPEEPAIECWKVARPFGRTSLERMRQTSAPTWNHAFYPDRRWTVPGLIGSNDVASSPEATATLRRGCHAVILDLTSSFVGHGKTRPHGFLLRLVPEERSDFFFQGWSSGDTLGPAITWEFTYGPGSAPSPAR